MLRSLNDVTTSSDSVLMSRPLLDVATSMFSLLKILCRDFYSVSRPPCLLFGLQFYRDIMFCSSLIYGCLTWSFCCDQLVLPSIALLSRLEFCGRDVNMSLHYCQGVATSGPLIFVHLSCCNLIQPVVSVLLSHFLLLLLQYPLPLEFPTA